VLECPPDESVGPDNLCHKTGGKDHCAPGLTLVNGACVEISRRKECGPGERRQPDGVCRPVAAPACPPGEVRLENGRCVSTAPLRPGLRVWHPGGPFGYPGVRFGFPGYRGGGAGIWPRHQDWRQGGGRRAPDCEKGECRR
jgi:hypothetical protein